MSTAKKQTYFKMFYNKLKTNLSVKRMARKLKTIIIKVKNSF